ncbi:MAG: histidine phosphatase family protein [Caldilineaceae bacterium]|nr:histidine phosphatase family protein [Caldilineaceae bacterium]
MRLLIIRHAESSNNKIALNLDNAAYMQQRSADPVITELGVRQTEKLAAHLAGKPPVDAPPGGKGHYGITHLYCSPMLRTLQTAKPIAAALGLRPSIWIDIHEHGGMFMGNPHTGENFHVHAGLTRADIARDYPDYELCDGIGEEGWWKSGYEDIAGCYARAIRVARELRRRAHAEAEGDTKSVVAIVSHGTFIDSLIKALFSQIPENEFFYFHNNTAITCLDFGQHDTLYLRYLNRTAHLPPEMISE